MLILPREIKNLVFFSLIGLSDEVKVLLLDLKGSVFYVKHLGTDAENFTLGSESIGGLVKVSI